MPATPAARPATPAAPAAAASVSYIVQLGAYSTRARADSVAQRAHANVVASGSLFRVRVGPFNSESEARAAATRLRSQGFPGAIVQRDR